MVKAGRGGWGSGFPDLVEGVLGSGSDGISGPFQPRPFCGQEFKKVLWENWKACEVKKRQLSLCVRVIPNQNEVFGDRAFSPPMGDLSMALSFLLEKGTISEFQSVLVYQNKINC